MLQTLFLYLPSKLGSRVFSTLFYTSVGSHTALHGWCAVQPQYRSYLLFSRLL